MNTRLQEIIKYKTGGKQTEFAELMGWSPQYLAKLIKGDNFGLNPVVAVLAKFPEVDARWLLFGQGEMLETHKRLDLQRQTFDRIQYLLDLEQYIPVMTCGELKEYETALLNGVKPNYSSAKLTDFEKRLNIRKEAVNARFNEAIKISDKQCRQRTANK